jgi:hypothetical protein
MMKMIVANRVLYGLFAGVLALTVGVPWIVGGTPDIPQDAVTVPRVTLPALQASQVSLPVRNPFDPEGEEWVPREAPAPVVVSGAGKSVRGFIRIGSTAGAMTETGFVPVGEMLSEGRLERVGGSEVTVVTSEGEQALPLENGIRQRLEKLKSGG